jgi:hypothetical protein
VAYDTVGQPLPAARGPPADSVGLCGAEYFFRLSLLCEPPGVTPQNEQATPMPEAASSHHDRALWLAASAALQRLLPAPHHHDIMPSHESFVRRAGPSRARGHTQHASPKTVDEERELLHLLSLTLLRQLPLCMYA